MHLCLPAQQIERFAFVTSAGVERQKEFPWLILNTFGEGLEGTRALRAASPKACMSCSPIVSTMAGMQVRAFILLHLPSPPPTHPPSPPAGVLRYKREAEQLLQGSGLPWTILRPSRLTDGPYTSYDLNTLLQVGWLPWFFGACPRGMAGHVHPRDASCLRHRFRPLDSFSSPRPS